MSPMYYRWIQRGKRLALKDDFLKPVGPRLLTLARSLMARDALSEKWASVEAKVGMWGPEI